MEAVKLENFHDSSNRLLGVGMEASKPSIEVILAEVEKKTSFFIYKYAGHLPDEQKEDIKQIAKMRLWEKYPEIEPTGWKAYISKRCGGVVMDYIKQGTGFEDGEGWNRLTLKDSEGETLEVENTLGLAGIFDKVDPNKIDIKWDIVAKMARRDKNIHAFAMQILGFQLRLIAPVLNVEIARADQLCKEFVEWFDDAEKVHCSWTQQAAYAFGISEMLGWPNEPVRLHDAKAYLAQHEKEVDLYSIEPHYNYKLRTAQMGFNFEEDKVQIIAEVVISEEDLNAAELWTDLNG